MKKVTIHTLQQMKQDSEKIVMLTAYDTFTAHLMDEAGVDAVLVGDSYGTTVLGYETTLPVTLDEMLSITAAVGRGISRALLVADMPFMSYQESPSQARRNAGRLIKETPAQAVKVEYSKSIEDIIKAIIDIDIPVMGHIGLTPQSVHRMGGFRIQGKSREEAELLLAQAQRLEELGAFAVVLEGMPDEAAKTVTEKVSIPTIGIGAGPYCDGQVQVIHDMVGYGKFKPKHAKQYADISETVRKAVTDYSKEVRSGDFSPDK